MKNENLRFQLDHIETFQDEFHVYFGLPQDHLSKEQQEIVGNVGKNKNCGEVWKIRNAFDTSISS